MILQKRLDYGFNGYQVPPMPRVPRFARRQRSFRKKIDDNQLCAFDLLTTVAGKLLVEGENPLCSDGTLTKKDTVETERQIEEIALKLKPCDKGVSNGPFSFYEPVSQAPIVNNTVKDGCLGNMGTSSNGASLHCILADESKKREKIELPFTGQVSVSHNVDVRSPVDAVALDNSPHGGGRNDDVKLVSRDDDENSSWCTKPSTAANKAPRPSPRIADRRIRKILASKYWKVTQKINEEEEQFTTDGEMKPVYPNGKNCYNCQRSVRDYPFKKRKLYDRCSLSTSNAVARTGDVISGLPEQDSNGDAFEIGTTKHGATGTSSFAANQHISLQSRDSHVKLKIKSFRIPELFIEMPETATVGSLKSTVRDAMTAILSGGLCVGVLLQGKRIRDDNKTLIQSGISHDKTLDALGFVLEPSQVPPPLCSEDRSLILPCETPQPFRRYPTAPSTIQQRTCNASRNRPITNFANLIEIGGDSAPPPGTPPNTPADQSLTKSKPLVSVPMSVDSLAAVPVRKPKRSDVSQQRRIRRPFSVSEVEALVQAVEKLGTGRWRDVKLRAFDNAKQRTYVDLKDKWKTLVHTARISPQQRRGEPVPQELLDRVLTAHAYWSQHQSKQQNHLKHHS